MEDVDDRISPCRVIYLLRPQKEGYVFIGVS